MVLCHSPKNSAYKAAVEERFGNILRHARYSKPVTHHVPDLFDRNWNSLFLILVPGGCDKSIGPSGKKFFEVLKAVTYKMVL